MNWTFDTRPDNSSQHQQKADKTRLQDAAFQPEDVRRCELKAA